MAVNSISLAAATTDRGTKIVRSTNEMDKDAFLKILTAELSNQNPENATDSTQYVAQMAQFAALEQMSTLNSTMSFMGASALIGKTVGLNTVDETGNQYIGTVKGATKDGGEIILSVEIEKNNTKQLMEFSYKDVLDVY